MGDFTLRWLSVPYIIQIAGLLALASFAVLNRGARLLRAALLFVVLAAMPYTLAVALCGSVNDPEIANQLSKFGVGAVSLIGAAMMMLLLAIAGKFEQHRRLFGIVLLLTLTTAIITWTTDLVVGRSWQTDWGIWVHRGGPLSDLHIGQFVLWSVVGLVLARRGNRALLTERRRNQAQFIAGGLAIALLSATDSLLTKGIGVYPFSFVPSILGTWFALYACARQDLLRTKGFDWAGLYEVFVVFALAAIVAGFLVVSSSSAAWSSPLVTVVVLVPVLLAAYVTAIVIRARVGARLLAAEAQGDAALDLFIEQARDARDETELRDRLEGLLSKHLLLHQVRLYLQDEHGLWVVIGDDESPPVKLDARVRAWLMTNQAPLITDELLTGRLGGLRKPIESFMSIVHAEIVVPMVDRGHIVGLVAASGRTDERTLRDTEKAELMQAASASARALTYMRLVNDARAKLEVVKEVEVAAAVQQARRPGEQVLRYGKHELISYYQPSPQFGGHWWTSHELPDGRILVVIGDVTGHGVSAALISFTVEGACETAHRMFGANFEALSLLQLLNQAVLDVGQSMYAMSCFVAVIDPDNMEVVFANAGHPFPYVCRRSTSAKRGRDELRALVSRGTPLGTDEPVLAVSSLALEADDVLVFFSDSIVDSRNPEGQSYGDRRFQRVLRNKVRDSGQRVCHVIMDDAQTFYGGRAIAEDINLVVLRLGAA